MSRASISTILLICFASIFAAARVDKDQCFFMDSLAKYAQSRSLADQNFQNEEYYYPARNNMDPEFHFFPFGGIYLVKTPANQYLGQYPIAFTFLSAVVLKFFSNGALYYISIVALLLLVGLFQFAARPNWLLLLAFAFGTPLLVMGLDYSEQLPYALINAIGIVGFASSFAKNKPWILFFSGLLIGLSSFLRLEHLMFCLAMGITALLLPAKTWKERFLPILPFAIGAAAGLGLFILFNQLRYGILLGPRMIANSGLFWTGWQMKMTQAITMLVAGKMQIGFLLYLPALVVLLVALFKKSFRELLTPAERILHGAIVLFIFVMSVAAPGDGALNWGPRYLVLSFFPGFLILSSVQKKVNLSKAKTRVMASLLLLPIAFTVVGANFRKIACRQQKQYISDFKRFDTDVWAFPGAALLHYQGPEYFGHASFYAEDVRAFSAAAHKHLKGKTISVFVPVLKFAWQQSAQGKITSGSALDPIWDKEFVRVGTVQTELMEIHRFRVD